MLKKVIITGVIFSSILLVGCNEKTEVVELAASKNGENVESLESKSNVLSELQNEIIDSITEQTKIDRESITIIVGGNPNKGIIDVSVGFPKKIKVDETLIQQIVEDSIKKISETESITINKEDITINIEKY